MCGLDADEIAAGLVQTSESSSMPLRVLATFHDSIGTGFSLVTGACGKGGLAGVVLHCVSFSIRLSRVRSSSSAACQGPLHPDIQAIATMFKVAAKVDRFIAALLRATLKKDAPLRSRAVEHLWRRNRCVLHTHVRRETVGGVAAFA